MTEVAKVHDPAFDPELVDVQMQLVPPTAPVEARVVKNELCMKGKSASYVRHVCIDVAGTPLEGAFKSGQSFGIVPPGEDEKGRNQKVRLYSIASPTKGEDGEGRVLSTTCKRLVDEYQPQSDDDPKRGLFLGLCSNYVCDLRPGDAIKVTGPAGKRFVLPKEPDRHDYLMLATGTGIAPFRGMILDLLEGPQGATTGDVHLVMGVPYTTDLLYDDLFRELSERHSNFHYHTVVSREIMADGVRGGYIHHYLDREVFLHDDLLRRDRTIMYVCGLAGMQTGVFQTMARLGVGGQYLKVKDELAGVDPAEWQSDQIKRYVRPTHRCMLEVY